MGETGWFEVFFFFFGCGLWIDIFFVLFCHFVAFGSFVVQALGEKQWSFWPAVMLHRILFLLLGT